MVMDVHLRDLRYFVAVATEGSVSRAAQGLFISQPALSKQIRALESQLRIPLFERLPQQMRLTAAGEELLPRARRLLAEWEAGQQAVVDKANCSIVLGMHTSPGRGLLPAVRANPDAVVLADGMSCRVQLDDLAQQPTMHLAELLASKVER